MESDSGTFYKLPGSGRKLNVPIKVKRGKVVSPTGVQNFHFDDECPDDERMALHYTPSYMSQEGEETVLLEGDDTEAELEARMIRKMMEEDEATHFTEGLGEEILLPEDDDTDDEEVNALAEELEGFVDAVEHETKPSSEEEKKEEDPSDLQPVEENANVDSETLVVQSSEAPETEKAEQESNDAGDKQVVSEYFSEPVPEAVAEKEDIGADKESPETVTTSATWESQEGGEDAEQPTTEKNLACSTSTTEDTQDPEAAEEQPESPEVEEPELQSDEEVPEDEQQTDTETRKPFLSPRGEGDDDSSANDSSANDSGRYNELMFVPAGGHASDTDYVTASDTDYATTDYATTDYATTDYATSFDYDTETTRDIDDSVSVNHSVSHSVAHSVANSIAADGKGPRTRMNEKERSKWSLFGCGIVEEVPSTKQEWWNFVLDSTEGALKTVGGNHWDDPWAEEDEFDDDFDAYLSRNRSNRPKRRTRSVSTSRPNARRPPSSRYRRAASAPRARTTRPKQDRRKQLV